MGKGTNRKNLVLLSGFSINDNNRGSAALGYGAISFLIAKGLAAKEDRFCMLKRMGLKFWHWGIFEKGYKTLIVNGHLQKIIIIKCFRIEWNLLMRYDMVIPHSPLSRLINQLKMVAATNGGDGLSDIYGEQLFQNRLLETNMAMKLNIPLVILPQTIGPFKDDRLKSMAVSILQYANHIYVRDAKFVGDLDNMQMNYEIEKDLSYYMQPEPWDIDIKAKAIGINVSGLAYSNKFLALAGEFDTYKLLIKKIIMLFQQKDVPIYLIPHSYNYKKPEPNNDDLVACKEVYSNLDDRSNIYLVDYNMTSPRVKYVISKMSFFVGTRMHANFAAIFTNVPVFGLAYSYKFIGAFEANGLSASQTYMINNLPKSELDDVVHTIDEFYQSIAN